MDCLFSRRIRPFVSQNTVVLDIVDNSKDISKNLKMCGDCHAAIALISKILQRTIVVRDAKVFHSFEDGVCRCNGKY